MAITIAACCIVVCGGLALFAAAICMLNQAQHYDDIADLREQVKNHIHAGDDYGDDYD